MNRNRLFVAGALVLIATGTVLAGIEAKPLAPEHSRDLFQVMALEPTRAGAAYGMQGKAMISIKNGVQTFGVSCIADSEEDGETYVVVVETSNAKYVVGTLTVFLGTASLKIEGPRPGMPAVQDIKYVHLDDAEGTLMEGWFQTQTISPRPRPISPF